MKLFSAPQIRACDQFTIEHEPIISILLMERAAQNCVNWLSSHFSNHTSFYIFCGNGNNGGDGFAIARILSKYQYDIQVFTDFSNPNYAVDAKQNFELIQSIKEIQIYDFDEFNSSNTNKNTIIIDALFGTGLNKPIEGKIKQLIKQLNQTECIKIAIDIPSGLYADKMPDLDSAIFYANHTLSFQFYKQAFLHPESGLYCGKIHLLDIQLSEEYINNTHTSNYIISNLLIKSIYKQRNDFSHKGTHGKVAIVGGSYGKVGAAVLSTKAALRSGAGITYTIAPKCAYDILQISCPEAMFVAGGIDYLTNIELQNDCIYGIGPGLGTNPKTKKSLFEFLEQQKHALVLDADALNIISEDKNYYRLFTKNTIITPHPKEFERLFGKTKNSYERLQLAKEKANQFEIVIILKDHHTQIVTPNGEVFYNITGNSGMAKGGSGDVLTGIITALLAQQYSSVDAAILGVWLHGKAGDIAAHKHSKEAMLPSDLIEEIGIVFLQLNNMKLKSFVLIAFPTNNSY